MLTEIAEEKRPISTISGVWFLQPQKREVSLNMATLHTVITLNFIDSVYCNIDINNAAGDISLSRTYTLKDNVLTLENLNSGHSVVYELDTFSSNGKRFTLRSRIDGVPEFFSFSLDDRIYNLMHSKNTLKRDEFLYPALDGQQRVSGTSQVYEIDGKLEVINDPNKAAIDSIDIHKLF